ncbi:MAG: UDP-N-acetylmuramoyl-L-alanine--D-glutamate ligase [Gemmatimonadaceae bacterium]
MTHDRWLQGEHAVIGLGRSGEAVSRLLRSHHARVYASDAGSSPALMRVAESLRAVGAQVDVGHHDLARVAAASTVIVSPGVPPDAEVLQRARAAGVPIVSEIEVALSFMPGLRYIAVTGTNGKSTVTALVAHLLRALGMPADATGNIGQAVSGLALQYPPPTWTAIELSSFQLHDTPSVRPDVGILTNLAPDHLDRYPSVAEYYADKRALFRNATSRSRWVVNADNAEAMEMVRGVDGVVQRYSARGRLCDAFYDRKGGQLIVLDAPLIARSDLPLLGDHNVGNALAAALAVMLADADFRTLAARERIAAGLRSVKPLAHRLETVGVHGGVAWIDDSKATNVASATVGVWSMDRPTVLLLGGKHKGESYKALIEPIRARCHHTIAYGAAASLIMEDLAGEVAIERVDGPFEMVMARARQLARPGDAVLLSPACSSYDMFSNFEERGQRFALLARGSAT